MCIEGKFTDIQIVQNSFKITTSNNTKPVGMSALSMLNRIEEVMLRVKQGGLQGPPELSREVIWKQLKEKALKIHDNYLAKTSRIFWFRRFRRWFFGIPQQEEALRSALARINKLTLTPPQLRAESLQQLPRDPILYIHRFLPVRDLGNLAQVSVDDKKEVRTSIVQRAQEYGFKGDNDDYDEAKYFLISLFKAISRLIAWIPEEYLVYNGKKIDPEATFKNIKLGEGVEAVFTQVLKLFTLYIPYMEHNNTESELKEKANAVKMLLLLGANPDVKGKYQANVDETPLVFCITRSSLKPGFRAELIRTLLDYGANPNEPIPNRVDSLLDFTLLAASYPNFISYYLRRAWCNHYSKCAEWLRLAGAK